MIRLHPLNLCATEKTSLIFVLEEVTIRRNYENILDTRDRVIVERAPGAKEKSNYKPGIHINQQHRP